MRKILFRGKRIDNGEWVEGDFGRYYDGRKDIDCISFPSNTMMERRCYSVDANTVGQYTGLNDKNGNKIFEGDILSSDEYPYTSDDKQNYFAEVVWCDNCPAFGLYTFKAPKSLVRGISEGCEFIEDGLSDFEIIGNIHDNPELIGGDE